MTSRLLYVAAIALMALHVIDDNFLQPQPGTSAGDHLVSGLVPLVLLALAAAAPARLRGALALALGVLGIAGGAEAVHYGRETGLSGDDFTGLLSLAAGLALLGLGACTLWRTRRTDDSLWWRYPRRVLLGVGGGVAIAIVAMLGYFYVAVHVARGEVPADRLGVPHENVAFTTNDGLELQGWYIPSRNGAAVIAFPGRKGPQPHARMLAQHGYGVLLFDRRGEGASDGDPNSWGWGGDRDVKAAIAYLQRRPDVDPDRIGGIGLSVGGELMIETAADTDDLAAVVSEGAGARASETLDQPGAGLATAVATAIKKSAVAVLANEAPPTNLRTLAGRITEPVLLIAAPNSPNGEELNRGYYAAARGPKTLWEIPEARHMGGLAARPDEYERRVLGFFDRTLR
jgi:dienelactone hydrolase